MRYWLPNYQPGKEKLGMETYFLVDLTHATSSIWSMQHGRFHIFPSDMKSLMYYCITEAGGLFQKLSGLWRRKISLELQMRW